MIIRHKTQAGGNCLAGIVLTLAFVPSGRCQTATTQENDPASSGTQEEIVVYGKKSLVNLRYELYAPQKNFYALFNSLNSDDKFDFECEYVIYLGYRRRHHVCQSNFAKKIEARAAARFAENMKNPESSGLAGAGWTSGRDRTELERLHEEMLDEMATLVMTNPELHKDFTELANARRGYDSEVEKRRKK